MQKKTIKKVIEKKLIKWLETIKDERLRASVKKNLLLSGGSIASMFLRTDVNDYDVYIQDKKVLESLVRYYTEELGGRVNVLTDSNTDPKDGLRNNAYGIAVRNLKRGQVKCFFPADKDKGGIKVRVRTNVSEGEHKLLFVSPNALSLSDDIQIVTRFSGPPETIHASFDFIHATNYFTFERGLVTNEYAMESLLTKQLMYQGSMFPLTSIIRYKKFIKRGWSISAGEILKIMFQVSELNLKDPDVLEEQLIGVDVAYFSDLIRLLRATPDVLITSDYLNNLINQVFNE